MSFPTFTDITTDGMIRRDLNDAQKAQVDVVQAVEISAFASLRNGIGNANDPSTQWKEWTMGLNFLIRDLAPIFPVACPAATECANLVLTFRMQGNQAILCAIQGKDNDYYISVKSWRDDAERTLRTLCLRANRYIATGC